jgi:deoxyadenosine/deoxycytidine kinase
MEIQNQMQPTNIVIISIEGNIGSGKTTLFENLKHAFSENNNIYFLREPVDDWENIKDADGNTMLQKFYADQSKYSFAFQMMAYISRLKILSDTFNAITTSPEYDINMTYFIITERSLYTDKCVFAKMLYEEKKIEDVCYQIYLTWFDEFTKWFAINVLVYLDTNPIICYNRIHKRSREGEELIPLTYLENCHNYHNSFLMDEQFNKSTKLYLNGDIDVYENKQALYEWIYNIRFVLSSYGNINC